MSETWENGILLPQYPTLTLTLHILRVIIGIIGFIINAFVVSIIAPPLIHKYAPQWSRYMASSRIHTIDDRNHTTDETITRTSHPHPHPHPHPTHTQRQSLPSVQVQVQHQPPLHLYPKPLPTLIAVQGNSVSVSGPAANSDSNAAAAAAGGGAGGAGAAADHTEIATRTDVDARDELADDRIPMIAADPNDRYHSSSVVKISAADTPISVTAPVHVHVAPITVTKPLPAAAAEDGPMPAAILVTVPPNHTSKALHIPVRTVHMEQRESTKNERQVSAVMSLMLLQSLVDLFPSLFATIFGFLHIIQPGWKGGNQGFECQIDGFANHFCSCLSIGCLMIVAFERYQTICHRARPSVAMALKLHGCAWIATIVVNIIPIVAYAAKEDKRKWIGTWVVHPNGVICLSAGRSIYIGITTFCYVFVGFSVIIHCHFRIALFVHRTARDTMTIFQTTKDIQTQQGYEHRIAFLMLVLTGAFVICWTPSGLAFLYYLIMDEHVHIVWDVLLFVLGDVSFILNPIVCAYVSPQVAARFNALGRTVQQRLCCSRDENDALEVASG